MSGPFAPTRRAGLACLALSLALIMLGLAAPSWADAPARRALDQAPDAPAAARTVSLVIDYGNGKQKTVEALDWRPGMTAWEATQAAARRPPVSPLLFTGQGATVFVTGIDGLVNQGGGSDKRNWQLWVNGAFAQAGVGAQVLQAGDRVLWKFALPPPPGSW